MDPVSAALPQNLRRFFVATLFEGVGDKVSCDYSELGGSENDLTIIPQLQMSQSYAGQKMNNGGGNQHKVQFVDSQTNNHVSFSPIRKTKSRSPSYDGRSPTRKKRRNRTLSENSNTLSMASSITSVSTNNESIYVAPDGGFGWVVVAASFFTNMIADGVTFSFAIMFEQLQKEFDSSAAVTAGVVSMFHAVPLLTGPIATWLTDKYGCRSVTICGSILASLGFLAAAFSHHIVLLYLFFGIISGFGLSLCYVASIIIVTYYFEKKRSFATGCYGNGNFGKLKTISKNKQNSDSMYLFSGIFNGRCAVLEILD